MSTIARPFVRTVFLNRRNLKRTEFRFRPLMQALEDRLAPAVYTVNALTDSGAGSGQFGDLRYCINQANANAGDDSINFAVTGTISLNGTPLTLLEYFSTTSITGPGASLLTIDAKKLNSVLLIDNHVTAAIHGLTLTNGTGFNGGGGIGGNLHNGGTATVTDSVISGSQIHGIINYGTLTVINSAITGSSWAGINSTKSLTIINSSINSNFGGGIYSGGSEGSLSITNSAINSNLGGGIVGSAVVTNCTITNNVGGNGGGVNGNNLVIANSTVSNNTASNGGNGGGIWAANLTVTNSTISGNYATGSGGGVFSLSNTSVANSTVANNTAGGSGGGIHIVGGGGKLTVTNSAIIGNSAIADGGGIIISASSIQATLTNSTLSGNKTTANGGGIRCTKYSTCTLTNCTVSGNTAVSGGGAWGSGDPFAHGQLYGHNSIIAGNVGGDVVGFGTTGVEFSSTCLINMSAAAAGLGTLGNYGGPTQTIPLLPGSPAIDAGNDNVTTAPLALTTDQRGSGFLRKFGLHVDIGAFESSAPIVSSVIFGDGTNQRSLVKQIVVNFSAPVDFMGPVATAFTVHRTGTGGTVGDVILSATPTTGPTSSVTIMFSGALTEFGSLVDGLYDLAIDAAQVSLVGVALDGNDDGVAGGSYFVNGTVANRYYRIFGDSDGNGVSAQSPDFIDFRNAFGGPSSIFDFNNDGYVTQEPDFIEFRNRFGVAP